LGNGILEGIHASTQRLIIATPRFPSMPRLTFGYAETGVDALSAFRYGILAEKYGFDALWLGDHFVDFDGDRLEPWTVLSAVAGHTKRIRLGSAVTDTQRNHPARTAQMVASLDVISRGRAILGIGAGEAMNIVPFGLPWEPPRTRLARLEETIRVIRALWASSRQELLNFVGQFYQLREAFLSQPPRQRPHPPIYVGAFSSKKALEVVGRYGDGWFAWFNTEETFKKRWSIIKEVAESVGRSAAKIVPISHLLIAFPRNTREKKAAMLTAKAVLLMERTVLASLGHRVDVKSEHYQNLLVTGDHIAKIMDAADGTPDDFVYRTMAIGETHEVTKKIEELARAGVRHFAVADLLSPKRQERTLKTLGKIIRAYR